MSTSVLGVVLLSLEVASLAVLLILVPAVWLGHALARDRVRARALIQTLVNLPLVLPPVAVGLLLLRLLSPLSWPGSWLEFCGPWLLSTQAAVVAAAVMSFPLLVRGAEAGFLSVPVRMEEVARGVGLSRRAVFWKVTLPLARGGVLAGFFLAFARALGEFGATVLVAGNIPGETQTLALGIYSAFDAGDDAAAWTLVGVSVLLALALGLISEFIRPRWRA